jgi:hypothetical protein
LRENVVSQLPVFNAQDKIYQPIKTNIATIYQSVLASLPKFFQKNPEGVTATSAGHRPV